MIIANLTIYECDGCKKQTFSVRNDGDYAVFEATWHSDIFYDFCPLCKNLSPVKTLIESAVRATQKTSAEVEYVH